MSQDAQAADSRQLIDQLRAGAEYRERRLLLEKILEMAPARIMDLVPSMRRLGPKIDRLLANTPALNFLLSLPVQPYVQTNYGLNIRFFSDGRKAASKTLLVAFTGAAKRPLMPHGAFLQALPAPDFDVVFLNDPVDLHYAAGIEPAVGGLLELSSFLKQEFRPKTYRRCATLGVSSGGFAALRAGPMLGAERAISLGGRPIWWAERLRKGGGLPSCFDPLCACARHTPTRRICVYAGLNEEDRRSAADLGFLPGLELVSLDDVDTHNVLFAPLRDGSLPWVLQELINGDPARLGTKISSVAL